MKLKTKKLNPNAAKWVRALRSGKYKQGKDRLAVETGKSTRYCCLGVACELYAAEHPKMERDVGDDGIVTYSVDGESSFMRLPAAVTQWLGLSDNEGPLPESAKYRQLSGMNDAGKRFKTIAKIIESQPEGLFV